MVWQFRDADVGIRITDLFWWLAIASTLQRRHRNGSCEPSFASLMASPALDKPGRFGSFL